MKDIMTGKLIGYIRNNPAEKNTTNQLVDLVLDAKFTDTGGPRNQPELAKLRTALRADDTLVVQSLDRIVSSVAQARACITELTDQGITLRVIEHDLTFTIGSAGPTATTMLNALADMEKSPN